MLRTSGHEEHHADDTPQGGQEAHDTGAVANENDPKGRLLVLKDEIRDTHPEVLTGDEGPDPDTLLNVTPRAKKTKRSILARLFNRETLKDVGAGMLISGAARYAIVGGGVLVGVSGLPIVMGSAVAAGVARTAWTIHKERKAYQAQTGENISFWDWANKKEYDADGKVTIDNKKKYLISLGASTAFATLGSTFMTYAMPHIEQWAAPVVDKIMKSETAVAIGGFFTGVWSQIAGDVKPAIVPPASKSDPEAIKRGMESLNKMMEEKGPQHTVLSPDAIQRRIEDAHAASNASSTVSPDAIQRRIEEAHAAVREAAPVHVAAPILSVSDKISALTHDADLSKRWQAIAQRAIEGNPQAQKDIASAVLNGTHGFDKNPLQAAEIYRAAADAGNMQAKVDLAYMQFHGLGGIKADTKAALETLRDHATGNKYARSVLGNLTGEGVVRKSASAALDRAVNTSLPITVIQPAPGDLTPPSVVTPVAVAGQIPDDASLNVTWNQNAEGLIEGRVKDAPAWLKDGMIISVPTARVQ